VEGGGVFDTLNVALPHFDTAGEFLKRSVMRHGRMVGATSLHRSLGGSTTLPEQSLTATVILLLPSRLLHDHPTQRRWPRRCSGLTRNLRCLGMDLASAFTVLQQSRQTLPCMGYAFQRNQR
jgi:hypothetical protein